MSNLPLCFCTYLFIVIYFNSSADTVFFASPNPGFVSSHTAIRPLLVWVYRLTLPSTQSFAHWDPSGTTAAATPQRRRTFLTPAAARPVLTQRGRVSDQNPRLVPANSLCRASSAVLPLLVLKTCLSTWRNSRRVLACTLLSL